MKKRLIFAMSAIVALFATSCQNEEDFGAVATDATVAFTVSTPEIATRAYSDGQTATVLQYAVYDAAGNELTDLTVTDAEIHGSTTVNLQLTTGNTYSVIFWAAAEGAPYTVDFGAKTMTVDYTNAVSNDENRDAFYKYHTFTVTGAQTEAIELRRPFAQLNIGTADYAASTSAGYTPVKSAVTVENIYNTLNLWNGEVSGDVAVTYNFADIKKDETFPVAGYDYLAMNYLLVAAEKEVIDVEFTYTDANNDAKTRTVGSVPVQRNYRTNIYGQLLTSDVDINVEIVPVYNELSYDAEALYLAAAVGGEVTLTEDVVLESPIKVQANMTINLNGKTITGNWHKNDGAVIKNEANLTLIGGTISSVANNGGSAIANYGNLTIENATINGAPREGDSWPAYPVNNYGDMTLTNATVTGYQGCIALNAAGTTVINNCELTKNYEKTSSHVFYVNHADAKLVVNGGTYNHNGFDGSLAYVNKGEVTINGGTFNAKDGGYGFAVLSAGKVTINGGDINAGLLGWGGQFVVKGGVYTSQPNANYIAEGYKAIKKDGAWIVVATANDVASLATAIENGGIVALTEDITITEAIAVPAGATAIIDLNGKEIKSEAADGFVVNNGGNLTISGNGKVVANGAPIRALGGKVIVEGGEFTQTGAWNTAVSTYRYSVDSREGGEIIIKGGTFKTNNGLINVSANSSVVIEGGNFEFDNNTGGTRHFAYISGTLTIKDGEFKGIASAAAGGEFFCGAGSNGKVIVEGGKFTSLWTSGSKNNIWSVYASGASIEIKGGIFNHNGGIKSQVIENTDTATKYAYPYMAK